MYPPSLPKYFTLNQKKKVQISSSILPKAWLLSLSRGSSSSSDEAILPEELSLVRWTAHCHMWAVPSPEAVNTSSLLGWKRKELTLPAWPVYCSSAWKMFLLNKQFCWKIVNKWLNYYYTSSTKYIILKILHTWPECMPHIMAVWSAEAVPKIGNLILDTDT